MADAQTIFQTGCVVAIILGWMCSIFSIYGALLFWKYHNQPCIKTRYPLLVILFVALQTWDLSISNTIFLITEAGWLLVPKRVTKTYFLIYYDCLMIILSLKYFLTIFRNKHENAIAQRKWKSILNPQTKTFWIKYKSTLGMLFHSNLYVY